MFLVFYIGRGIPSPPKIKFSQKTTRTKQTTPKEIGSVRIIAIFVNTASTAANVEELSSIYIGEKTIKSNIPQTDKRS